MTVDAGEGGPPDAADGGPLDGGDGGDDESDGRDVSGERGGGGPARRPGGQKAEGSSDPSATDSEDLAGGGDRPPSGTDEGNDHPSSCGLGTLRIEATIRTPPRTKGGGRAAGSRG